MKIGSEINRLGISANKTEPVMWAVDDFLPVGLSVLTGGAKVGKSYLALNFALGVSTGGRVLGQFKAQKGGVLNLALEDTQRRLYPLTKNETGEWLSENSGTIGIADTADTIFVLDCSDAS